MVQCKKTVEARSLLGGSLQRDVFKVDCTKVDCTIDYFKLFGLSDNLPGFKELASKKDIKSAEQAVKKVYQELALKYHPDKVFVQVSAIYDSLKNEDFVQTYKSCVYKVYNPYITPYVNNELRQLERFVNINGVAKGFESYLNDLNIEHIKTPEYKQKIAAEAARQKQNEEVEALKKAHEVKNKPADAKSKPTDAKTKSEGSKKKTEGDKEHKHALNDRELDAYDPIKYLLKFWSSPELALDKLLDKKISHKTDLETGKLIDYAPAEECLKDAINNMGAQTLLQLCGKYVVHPDAVEF